MKPSRHRPSSVAGPPNKELKLTKPSVMELRSLTRVLGRYLRREWC